MEKIEKILSDAELEGRYSLYEAEVYELLQKIGIQTQNYEVVDQISKLKPASRKYGDKIVMKISSPDILHKTDIGAVKIVDNNLNALEKNYQAILKNARKSEPNAKVNGVLLTEYIDIDYEILVSMLYDNQFGNFLTVGMGGVMAEIYKDISIRLAPISKKGIQQMLQELKSYPIIQGYRGKKGVNEKSLISTIFKLNKLAEHFSPYSGSKYVIKELEINPLASSGKDIIPVDGLLRFEKKKRKNKSKVTAQGIEKFFNPDSVAIIGATEEKRPDGSFKEGSLVMEHILKSKIANIYPVNPKRDHILNKKCYKNIKDIPSKVDLAILIVPAKATPRVMTDIKAKGTKNAIILGGGFGEIGKKGKDLESKLIKISKDGDIRIIGPNCMGTYFADTQLNTIFLPEEKFRISKNKNNNVAVITQSGAIGVNLMNFFENIGIKYFISTGNMIDPRTDCSALINYFENKKDVAVIGLYVEGFEDGRRFYETAKKIKKPVVIMKGGKSKGGAKATASHTGSMAGNYKIAKTAFKQANLIEAETLQDFYDTLQIFSYLKDKKVSGNKVAIISNAGGLGVAGADMVANSNIELADYTSLTKKRLSNYYEEYLKDNAGDNPADLGGSITDKNFGRCLKVIMKDRNVNGILVSLGIEPQPLNENHLIKNIIRLSEKSQKPLVVTLASTERSRNLIKLLEQSNVPCYLSPEQGVKALDVFMSYNLP